MSITLTTPTSVTITGPGAISETDSVGACAYMSVDYINQIATFEFRTGTLVNGNLKAGQYGPMVTLTVNLLTGAWISSTGQSGVIAGGALTSFNTQVKGDRNLVETFAAGGNGNFLPGTQVPW